MRETAQLLNNHTLSRPYAMKYLIVGGLVIVAVVGENLRMLVVRDGTIPNRRSTEIDEAVGFQIVGVKADLLPLVQRADGPDDRLRSVRQNLMVQFVVRLQRPLVRDNAISVHQRRVQQSNRIRVLLRKWQFARVGNSM